MFKKSKDKANTSKSANKKLVAARSITPEDHRIFADEIIRSCRKLKVVLFAGAGIETLPLKIPVNTAIELSKAGKKCLLVDTDTKRNAVAAAFDLETDEHSKFFLPHPHATSFDNLKILPACFLSSQMFVSINSLIESAVKKYDFILINAPFMDGHIDRIPIASSSQSAFIFTANDSQSLRLCDLLSQYGCKVIFSSRLTRPDADPNG